MGISSGDLCMCVGNLVEILNIVINNQNETLKPRIDTQQGITNYNGEEGGKEGGGRL